MPRLPRTPLLLLAVLLLPAACATSSPGGAVPARPATAAPADGVGLATAGTLGEALDLFARHGGFVRQAMPRGAPMPPAQVDAWWSLLARVDAWRARPRPDPRLAARVHGVLKTELTADARAYGDMPPGVAERALATLRALAPMTGERPASSRERPPPGPPSLSWPLAESAVTSEYGPRHHPLDGALRLHAGVDLAAQPHQPVLASAPGRVLRVGWNGGHGLQVELLHAGGLRTRYSHLSRALVEEGEELGRGDVLGLAGRTGRTTGIHLHFEVWLGGEPLDPLEVLELGTSDPGSLTVSGRWPD